MQTAEVLDTLGYQQSPNFLKAGTGEFCSAVDYGHIFRRAAETAADKKPCSLKGVYTLRQPRTQSLVPIVYVCEALSEQEATEIHRYVWNQDVVPFLFVNTRDTIRVYSGFRHSSSNPEHGLISVLTNLSKAAALGFHAEDIDSGRLWRLLGREVTPNERVEWRLLDNLKKLDAWLQNHEGLAKETSHALIGKYVYLHYLRGRNILSDKKFDKLRVAPDNVFGDRATLSGVRKVVRYLDRWLNGRVFPLKFDGRDGVEQNHLRWVAGAFNGDDLGDEGYRQLHLDFPAYDFSYIPVETLSVVYEQFLHGPEEAGKKSKARVTGAYYTPIPVVNYILSELEQRRPLQRGMRVFDPSCGSGAFLVQSYRRLIEKEYPWPGPRPSPKELRQLLQKHIYGVDSDPDACSVTELSLVLTLLDYVEPPDLEDRRSHFKLPKLRDRNIFHGDFFQENAKWRSVLSKNKCSWIVGNPPWKKLDPKNLLKRDEFAWEWMAANKADMPVADNQLARAFAWRMLEYVRADGVIGLLLPAKTLVDDRAQVFRKAFFQGVEVATVANFANLRHVLFGKAVAPAAAFIYAPRSKHKQHSQETICVYSPLVANQETTHGIIEGTRNECWNLIINASEMRRIPMARASSGDGLVWKVALWGSHLDLRLIRRLERKYASSLLGDLEDEGMLVVAEGFQPRPKEVKKGSNKTEFTPSILDKKILHVEQLTGCRHIFVFPQEALPPNKNPFIRLRGGKKGLTVCEAPHVIVSAARTFAVYSNTYIIVPPRQIGIASPSNDEAFLKALALYLSSDFAYYHQFMVAADLGFERDRATFSDLKQIPLPLSSMESKDLEIWVDLHARLVEASRNQMAAAEQNSRPLLAKKQAPAAPLDNLIEELNRLVNDALGLTERERALIRDLVKVRLELNDGRLGQPAISSPRLDHMRNYGQRLTAELNAFIGDSLAKRFQVAVAYDELSAMIEVNLVPAGAVSQLKVFQASDLAANTLAQVRDRLRKQCSQWVYFDRNLRIYKGTRTYILKPMQRFHWTESQAMCDAAEIIAETLEGPGADD